MQGGRTCICKILRRWRTSCNCADNYERGGTIDGSITSSMDCVVQSMDFFQVGGPARDETGETHRQTNALIHGWGKYPWMINFYEWGATHLLFAHSCLLTGLLYIAYFDRKHCEGRLYSYMIALLPSFSFFS